MPKRRYFIVFTGLGLLTAVTIFLFFRREKSYTWQENYQERNKEPYGLSAIYQLTQQYFNEQKVQLIRQGIGKELPAKTTRPGTYFFIGEFADWDSLEINALLRFVRNGNHAMIASRQVPHHLFIRLNAMGCPNQQRERLSAIWDTAASFNLAHPDLKLKTDFHLPFLSPYNSDQQRPAYEWQFFGESFLCNSSTPLEFVGYLNGVFVNFVRIRYGLGWVYFHTNPIAFTNFALLQPQGKDYAERIWSHFPGGPVYWDIATKNPVRQMNQEPATSPQRRLPNSSPMDYILRQPPLAMAWYLLLMTALLFLAFRTKRRQRAIPVLPARRNLSLEFVRAIGRMNLLQRYHKKIAHQQMKYFLQHLRDRYHIDTREPGDAMVSQIAKKIPVEEEKIRSLLQFYQNIERGSIVTDNSLMEFHQRLQEIYQLSQQNSSNNYGRR